MPLFRIITLLLLGISTSAFATALNINLPIGSCPSGSVMAAGGACGALPNLNDQVAPVVVTAPRLDANGNPISGVNNSYHTPTTSTPGYVPTGWTNTGSALTPPSTVPADNLWSYTNGAGVTRSSSTPLATCMSILQDNPGKEFKEVLDNTSTSKICVMWTSSAHTGTASANMGLTYSCSAGRTLSGSNCNTSNAAQVPRPIDGHCNIIQNGSSFSGDPSDPDCSAATQGASLGTSGLTVAAQGGSVSVTPNTDGSTKVTISTTNTDNSTSTTTTINISGGGQATGVGQGQTAGTGTAATTSAITAPTPPLDISGLNKESTQSQIKTGIDTLHTDLTGDGSTASANKADGKAEVQTSTDALVESIHAVDSEGQESLFDEVGDLIKPFLPASVGCTPWTGSVIGKTFSFDWCPYIDKLTSTIGWLMALFSMFSIFQIATRVD